MSNSQRMECKNKSKQLYTGSNITLQHSQSSDMIALVYLGKSANQLLVVIRFDQLYSTENHEISKIMDNLKP